MLIDDENRKEIQALPIHAQTFVGIPSNQACAGQIVHANEDGGIKFIFDGDDVDVTAVKGQDFAVSKECTGVTSTISVIIS